MGDDAARREPRVKPVDAGRPGDDRPQMAERFDRLDLGPGAGDDRVDDQRGGAVERRDLFDSPDDRDARDRSAAESLGDAAGHDEFGAWNPTSDARPRQTDEVGQTLAV